MQAAKILHRQVWSSIGLVGWPIGASGNIIGGNGPSGEQAWNIRVPQRREAFQLAPEAVRSLCTGWHPPADRDRLHPSRLAPCTLSSIGRAADFGSAGWGFESLRVYHSLDSLTFRSISALQIALQIDTRTPRQTHTSTDQVRQICPSRLCPLGSPKSVCPAVDWDHCAPWAPVVRSEKKALPRQNQYLSPA